MCILWSIVYNIPILQLTLKMKLTNSRPTGAGATALSGGDPAVLPEHSARVHHEPAERVLALPRHVRQDIVHTVRTTYTGHAEL